MVPRSARALPPGRWKFCYQPVGHSAWHGKTCGLGAKSAEWARVRPALSGWLWREVSETGDPTCSPDVSVLLAFFAPRPRPARLLETMASARRKKEPFRGKQESGRPHLMQLLVPSRGGQRQAEGALSHPARGVCWPPGKMPALPREEAPPCRGWHHSLASMAPASAVLDGPGGFGGVCLRAGAGHLTKVAPRFPMKLIFRGKAGACPTSHSLSASK